MLKPDTHAKTGAAKHTGDITHRWEGKVPGGRAVEPHPDRQDGERQPKIERMKRKAQVTEKIG